MLLIFSAVSVMRKPDEISVYIGGNQTDCDDPMLCPSYKASYCARKVKIIPSIRTLTQFFLWGTLIITCFLSCRGLLLPDNSPQLWPLQFRKRFGHYWAQAEYFGSSLNTNMYANRKSSTWWCTLRKWIRNGSWEAFFWCHGTLGSMGARASSDIPVKICFDGNVVSFNQASYKLTAVSVQKW